MAKDIAIRAEGLGKQYRLGQQVDMSVSLREMLMALPHAIARRARHVTAGASTAPDATSDTIWALRDVDLEVEHGEVLGIIGRNGAGKSTLLKILSCITTPTMGYAEVHGRLSSLIEVGTGFHPELTGRENIYLNGAILGMRKGEIDRKFDEIVSFAEVERFLDTPVKRYSSGMAVRLAFAVAAHLEPEIMVIDEVLAVGDTQFQRKCLVKMREAAQGGQTVLLVSHQMPAIENLCSRCILLENGQIIEEGPTADVVTSYVTRYAPKETGLSERTDREGDGKVRFTGIEFCDEYGNVQRAIRAGRPMTVRLRYESSGLDPRAFVRVSIFVTDEREAPICNCCNQLSGEIATNWPAKGMAVCSVPQTLLVPGDYRIAVLVSVDDEMADLIMSAAQFEVLASDYFGGGKMPHPAHGKTIMPHSWYVEEA